MPNQIFDLIIQYKYFIMIPLTVVEGPIIMFVSGILLRLGFLSLLPAYITLIVGDLIGDILWYGAGYHWGEPFVRKFGKYVSITEDGMKTAEEIFHRHKDKILIVSKLTMGFGFSPVILLTAGIVRIPFRRYIILNVIGQFFWVAFLLSFGYFFAHVYSSLADNFSRITIITLFVVLLLLLFGFGKYIRGKIIKQYKS